MSNPVTDAALEAAKVAYLREFNHDENAALIARIILKAAAPHMLEHFANRIDWRCVDCEDPVGPGKALKLLKEARND